MASMSLLAPGLTAIPINNESEIARAIDLANNNRNVVRVIVGNETILRQDVTVEELTAYLDRVRDHRKAACQYR